MTGRVTARRFRLLRPVVWFAHTGIRLFVLAYFLVALTVLGVRHLVLPKVPEYREDIAAYATRLLGERVTIGSVEARWSGLHPTLAIGDLRIHDRDGRVALALPAVTAQVSWRSLAFWELRFHSLVFDGPSLAIRRTAEGKLRVAGIEVKDEPGGDQALGDWILRQGEIAIGNGRVLWIDELRGAPVLALNDVAFRLVNRLSGRHQVALRAVPPPALASAIDVRADVRGDSLDRLDGWHGRAFARLESTDLAGWKPWLDYPIDVTSGRGGVQAWVEIDGRKIVDATFDLGLADVIARVDRAGPPLELRRLEGRAGVRELRPGTGFFGLRGEQTRGFAAFADDIALEPMRGRAFEPFDMTVRVETPPSGTPRGEVRTDRLDVGALAEVAEGLPLPTAVRQFLAKAQPRGTLSAIVASWSGEIEAPTAYSASLAFKDLSVKPAGALPGFSALGGTLELSQAGGTVRASGSGVRLDYPSVLRDPVADLEKLDVHADWTIANREGVRMVEVRFPQVAASNRDLALAGSGQWRSSPESRGVVDVDLRVPRLELAAVHRYLPFLNDRGYAWMRRALQAGTASEGRVQLRGDLARFPFADRTEGLFEVRAKIAGGQLEYDDQWPRVEGIAGDYLMEGRGIVVTASRGTTAGAQLTGVRVRMPEWKTEDPLLDIEGGADGATPDFLRFLQTTPLKDGPGKATAAMSAEGRGRLSLTLGIPLKRAKDTRVAGSYLFNANRVVFDPDQPPLSQVSGRLEFSERGIATRGIGAQFLGGPTTIAIAQREDRAYVVSAQGTATSQAIAAAYDLPFVNRMQGQAPYRAVVTLPQPRGFELSLDSNLQGMALDLPAPLGKTAQESVPLHMERTIDAERTGRNALSLTLGRVATVEARFRPEGQGHVLDRAGVGIGEASATLPSRPGIAVAVDMKAFDAERLLAGLTPATPGGTPGAASATSPQVIAVSMKGREVTAFGRRWNDVTLDAAPRGRDAWAATVAAREVAGDVEWRSEANGPGRVVARLKHLVVPESAPGADASPTAQAQELPALDVTAESFTVGTRQLGRLELGAVNEARVWRIQNLLLAAPEGNIRAKGSWVPRRGDERTEVSFTVDVSDAGKYLARLGQPNTVAGGLAKLEGAISWSGPPYAVSYGTMAGNMTFHAEQGRFLRAQPGVTRLLGVLSLQSLPRRISLDFRDVFSEGFTFDQINATATVTRGGILATQDFRMTGPQAGVLLTGNVDLDRETQDLRVRVVPIVGDSVAAVTALALLNPVVGLGTLIAQRLLKDPLGQVLAHEYTVTGNWSDPKVDRVLNVERPNTTPTQ